MGLPAPSLQALRLGPKPARRVSHKSYLLGASPLFLRTPLQMEEQGDLRSEEDGTEGSAGFQQLSPVPRTQALGVRAPWRQRAAYRRMQVSCGGQGTVWALSR